MGPIFSFFNPKPQRAAPPPALVPGDQPKKAKKTSSKRAQLIALKSTGAGGLTDEASVGRKRILV